MAPNIPLRKPNVDGVNKADVFQYQVKWVKKVQKNDEKMGIFRVYTDWLLALCNLWINDLMCLFSRCLISLLHVEYLLKGAQESDPVACFMFF